MSIADKQPIKLKPLYRKETTIIMVPPGTTNKVQPLDVAVNSEFKNVVDRLATEHMSSNMKSFHTASDRRVLFTNWVGQAWQEVSRRLNDDVSADVEDMEFFLLSLTNLTMKTVVITCKLFIYFCYSFIIERKESYFNLQYFYYYTSLMTSSYVS